MLKNYHHIRLNVDDRFIASIRGKTYYKTVSVDEADKVKFLFMPAPAVDSTQYFYIFNCDSQRDVVVSADDPNDPCAALAWTIDSHEDSALLRNAPFTGRATQQFAFEPVAGNGKRQGYRIKCKHSGKYLYRSDSKKDRVKPIRQTGSMKEPEKFIVYVEDLGVVPVPEISKDGIIPPAPQPPSPSGLNDNPSDPDPVFIGEARNPFYRVNSDSEAVGPLRYYQVTERPYYVLIRRQQWQLVKTLRMAPKEKDIFKVTHEAGMTLTHSQTMTRTTGFMVSIDVGTKATLGVPDEAMIEATRAFHAEYSQQIHSEVSEMSVSTTREEETIEKDYEATPAGMLIVYWTLNDLWATKGKQGGMETTAGTNPTAYGAITYWPQQIDRLSLSRRTFGLDGED